MRQEAEDHLLSLWLDFPWVAGGRLQVDAFPLFFLSSLPPYSSPCQTSPCYHGNTGRAEPWDRGMQTEERSTLPFPQSTGRRESPSTQPKTEMDQRYHNSVAFNTVLYVHCKSGFIIHIFCACVCVHVWVYKSISRTAAQTQNGHLSLWLLCYSFGTSSAPVYFNMLPEKKLINTIKQKSYSWEQCVHVCRDIYFHTTCRIWMLCAHKWNNLKKQE